MTQDDITIFRCPEIDILGQLCGQGCMPGPYGDTMADVWTHSSEAPSALQKQQHACYGWPRSPEEGLGVELGLVETHIRVRVIVWCQVTHVRERSSLFHVYVEVRLGQIEVG